MRLHQQKPAARGVNQLMYLSGDGTPMETVTLPVSVKFAIGAVVVWLLLGAR